MGRVSHGGSQGGRLFDRVVDEVGGLSVLRLDGGGGGRADDSGRVVRDSELGRVLVVAGGFVNQLDGVACEGSVEAGGRSPDVGSRVGDASDDGSDRHNIGGGAAEEDQGDGARGARLQRRCQILKQLGVGVQEILTPQVMVKGFPAGTC